jgi:hypothetical protein
MTQRELMRRLVAKLGKNADAVCRTYAAAEKAGQIERRRDKYGLSPEQYAQALWRDAQRRGWISGIA